MKVYLVCDKSFDGQELISLHSTRKGGCFAYHKLRMEKIAEMRDSVAYWNGKCGLERYEKRWIKSLKRHLAALQRNDKRAMERGINHGMPVMEVREMQE